MSQTKTSFMLLVFVWFIETSFDIVQAHFLNIYGKKVQVSSQQAQPEAKFSQAP